MSQNRLLKQNGFTIVELLIVVVVIAILAAITIVAYNGISNQAKASAMAAEIASIEKQLELEKVKSGTDSYPAPGSVTLNTSGGVTASFLLLNSNLFCTTVTKDGASYAAARGKKPAPGSCVVNLVKNPKGIGTPASYNSSGWFYPLGTTTDQANVTWGGRSDWHRFVWSGTGATTQRLNVDLAALQNGQRYTASILVANPGSSAATFAFDFVDQSSTGFTIAPGESRRVTVTALRAAYDSTFRFMDIELTSTQATGLLLTDAMLTRTDAATGYGDGGQTGWAWTGTENSSTSVGPAQ